MRFSFLSLVKIINFIMTQLEALSQRPELGRGLPCPRTELEAEKARLDAAKAKQELAKKALKLATDEVQQIAFELKGKTAANVAVAAMLYGPYSREFIALGGKPRKSRRAPETPETPTADGTDSGSDAK